MDEYFNSTLSTHNAVDISYLLHLSSQFPLYGGYPEVFGYILPPVIVLTLVTNCLVITVLIKKEMRTPTNVILAGLAFSDMMCGVIIFPVFFNFFTLGKYNEIVPFDWCLPYQVLIVLASGFHNISVLQTVALATQRYIFICVPKARSKLNYFNALKVVVILHIIGLFAHAGRFLDTYFVPAFAYQSISPDYYFNSNNIGCITVFRDWVKPNLELYVNVYFILRATCFGILPCIILTILTTLLIKSMTSQRMKRRRLFRGRGICDGLNQQDKQNVRTTLLLIVVVGIHLFCEIPNSVVLFIDAVEAAIDLYNVSNAKLIVISISNIMVILSCPVNIFIYCGMSMKFRTTLKQMLKCR
ncbi:sex peptide receptor-like [Ruditapes philippinarum]|uniref:sex peptide receptor-like n=1 Tax=Ruditapes philippinarum TaxID=129788 RepID=UPI00295BF50F|nr:sex peptide receptor-like [Ruditapes philippinarum]